LRLLVIAGPTGTGKTELAVALARRIDGEIVGCDALQVYRGFDAATAKPDAVERSQVPHHLVDCVDPDRDFSLAEYVRLAESAVAAIHSRGRVPVIVGGTGLYLRGLLRGVVEAPGRDAALRERLRRLLGRFGPERLHKLLCRLDPGSAERIPPRDAQRIVRALEVVLSGEETWSRRLERAGTWSAARERYVTVKIGLDMQREALYRRLDTRVARFFERGLVDEVRSLLRAGVAAEANAFKAIGYREVLRELLCGGDPTAVADEIRRNTRRYSKRQRTWFRKEPGMRWLDAAQALRGKVDEALAAWEA
jgi:tRNA dimethylallyltransferase